MTAAERRRIYWDVLALGCVALTLLAVTSDRVLTQVAYLALVPGWVWLVRAELARREREECRNGSGTVRGLG